eukprot:1158274-Pelagomonas_calceolata.AAC.34
MTPKLMIKHFPGTSPDILCANASFSRRGKRTADRASDRVTSKSHSGARMTAGCDRDPPCECSATSRHMACSQGCASPHTPYRSEKWWPVTRTV